MAEYIERDELLADLRLARSLTPGLPYEGPMAKIVDTFFDIIATYPAADVVPVVRCGECIHRVNMEHSMDNKEICCGRMAMRVMALDDYCSHGVRIDGGKHHAD